MNYYRLPKSIGTLINTYSSPRIYIRFLAWDRSHERLYRETVATRLHPIVFVLLRKLMQNYSKSIKYLLNMLSNAFRTGSKQIASASRRFATYKSSTGLVGLAVDPNGRETLQDLAAQILSSVKVRQQFYCIYLFRIQ